MSIGVKIKQKKFRNEYLKATANLFYTSSYMALKTNNYLKTFGLTMPQYNILRILRGQFPNPAPVNLVIDRMLDKASNASRIIDKLETKSLVKRQNGIDDRRVVNVIISRKGMKLLEEIDAVESDMYFGLINLVESEIIEFNRLLDKIHQNNSETRD